MKMKRKKGNFSILIHFFKLIIYLSYLYISVENERIPFFIL